MGLTIHYSGTFRSDKLLGDMIEEAVAFAKTNDWDYSLMETAFPPDSLSEDLLYGISVTPPNCDSICLWFNSNRKLGFFIAKEDFKLQQVELDENGEAQSIIDIGQPDYPCEYFAFTKTQFAGSGVHIKVVELLKKISEKYLEDFVVSDDSDYWNHGDQQLLRKRFGECIDLNAENLDFKNPDFRIQN